MLFDPSNWALVKRLRADKMQLLAEYAAYKEKMKPKLNPDTTFDTPLFSGDVGILAFIFDPTLWAESERQDAFGGKGLTSMDKFYMHTECNVAMSIVKDFPAIRQMYWTTLPPGGKVNPHYGIGGVIQNRIADHWRLQICWEPGDGNAAFFLQDKKVVYKEDLCFGFHDGMELHWAVNDGNIPRTVMIIDVHRHLCESADIPHPDAISYV